MQQENFNSEFFYDRLLQELNIKRDIELAQILGVAQPTVSGWRKRGSVDLPLLVEKLSKHDIDWNFVLTGTKSESKVNAAKIEQIKALLNS